MKVENWAMTIAAIAVAFAGWSVVEMHQTQDQVEWLAGAMRARESAAATSVAQSSGDGSESDQSDRTNQPNPAQTALELPAIMTSLQMDAAKLYFAGKSGNWPLAQYEASKIEAGLAAVPSVRRRENGVPLGAVIQSFENSQWAALKTTLAEQNKTAFEGAYTNMVFICNACHQAIGRPFIHITVPSQPPVSNQLWKKAPPVVTRPMGQ